MVPGQPRNWNDWLALLVLVGVAAMWVWADLPETVQGATIMLVTLVGQYYFRRAPRDKEE